MDFIILDEVLAAISFPTLQQGSKATNRPV
jgi:hypothetical protein